MNMTFKIKHHIRLIKSNQMFTSRDFLIYGTRGIIDQVLFKLVKKGEIIRLARGVFIKEGSIVPTINDIALFKASSFSKNIIEHASIIAKKFGLVSNNTNEKDNNKTDIQEIIYSTDGSSSSFLFGNTKIVFKKTARRKMLPGQSLASYAIKALWYLGKEKCTDETIHQVIKHFYTSDKHELDLSGTLMPGWMNKSFGWFRNNRHSFEYVFWRFYMPTSSLAVSLIHGSTYALPSIPTAILNTNYSRYNLPGSPSLPPARSPGWKNCGFNE